MVVATEETRLLAPSSSSSAAAALVYGDGAMVVDIDEEQQHSMIEKSRMYNTNNNKMNPAFKLNSFVITKIISYSAVAISIILGMLLVVTAIENTIRYDNTLLGNSLSSLSWFTSSSYYHHHDDNDDWGHFHKWKKDKQQKWHTIIDDNDNTTASDHYHSSSYEYDSDGTKNGTKHIHTDYEQWTIHNTNGTVTHYESWIDKDGIQHTTSYTTSD